MNYLGVFKNGKMEELFMQLTSSFDLKLMLSITISSYGVLKLLDTFVKKTSKILKKIITLILSTILCVIYYFYVELSISEIIPTYLISIVFYDNLIKFILNKLNLGYKKDDN